METKIKKIILRITLITLLLAITSACSDTSPEAKREALANYNLAERYFDNEDYAKALPLFEKASAGGNADATLALGGYYFRGIIVKKDMKKGLSLLKKAAADGSVQAYREMSRMYFRGAPELGIKKDSKAGLKWITKAIDKGDAYAAYELGSHYLSGKFIPVDKEKALMYIKMAAENGNTSAQRELARLELLSLAEEGDAEAQYKLGKMSYGEEKPQWLLKASDQGHIEAQYELGRYYQLEKDYERAIYYLQKASDNGHKSAIHYIIMIYDEQKEAK